jgi:hypothetical protein
MSPLRLTPVERVVFLFERHQVLTSTKHKGELALSNQTTTPFAVKKPRLYCIAI